MTLIILNQFIVISVKSKMAAWKAAILNGFRVVLYTITFISSCGTHQTLSFPKNSNPVEMPGKAGEGRVVGVANLFPFYQDGTRRNWYVGGSPLPITQMPYSFSSFAPLKNSHATDVITASKRFLLFVSFRENANNVTYRKYVSTL